MNIEQFKNKKILVTGASGFVGKNLVEELQRKGFTNLLTPTSAEVDLTRESDVKGYFELQSGSTFGVMPSIYEPFGSAIEFLTRGTPVVARKTGGLVNQVTNGTNKLMYRESRTNYNKENIDDLFSFNGDSSPMQPKN